MSITDRDCVFRDSTFTMETRDVLDQLADMLDVMAGVGSESAPHLPRMAGAVREVVARWDANEATEFIGD